MAVSSSYNRRENVQTIIDDAARVCGQIGAEEGLNVFDSRVARRFLNNILSSWHSDGMPLWAIKQTAFNLTAAKSVYKIGETQVAPEFSAVAPERVLQAFRRDTDTRDTPLQLLTREEYWNLPNKEEAGTPTCVWYRLPQGENYTSTAWYGEVRVWPVPDSTAATEYDLVLVYTRPFQDLDTFDDDLDLPKEWFRAVVAQLAADMSYTWQLPYNERQILAKRATELHGYALLNGSQEGSLYIQPEPRR